MKTKSPMEREVERNTSKKFLQSYLYTEFGKFFVSTCHRKSSADLDPFGWYYETFAWKLKDDGHRENRIIADNSGAERQGGAFEQHIEVCRQLELKGEFKEEEDDD